MTINLQAGLFKILSSVSFVKVLKNSDDIEEIKKKIINNLKANSAQGIQTKNNLLTFSGPSVASYGSLLLEHVDSGRIEIYKENAYTTIVKGLMFLEKFIWFFLINIVLMILGFLLFVFTIKVPILKYKIISLILFFVPILFFSLGKLFYKSNLKKIINIDN